MCGTYMWETKTNEVCIEMKLNNYDGNEMMAMGGLLWLYTDEASAWKALIPKQSFLARQASTRRSHFTSVCAPRRISIELHFARLLITKHRLLPLFCLFFSIFNTAKNKIVYVIARQRMHELMHRKFVALCLRASMAFSGLINVNQCVCLFWEASSIVWISGRAGDWWVAWRLLLQALRGSFQLIGSFTTENVTNWRRIPGPKSSLSIGKPYSISRLFTAPITHCQPQTPFKFHS